MNKKLFFLKDGHSALSISAKNGYTDIVLSLLERGAYVNVPNKVIYIEKRDLFKVNKYLEMQYSER